MARRRHPRPDDSRYVTAAIIYAVALALGSYTYTLEPQPAKFSVSWEKTSRTPVEQRLDRIESTVERIWFWQLVSDSGWPGPKTDKKREESGSLVDVVAGILVGIVILIFAAVCFCLFCAALSTGGALSVLVVVLVAVTVEIIVNSHNDRGDGSVTLEGLGLLAEAPVWGLGATLALLVVAIWAILV